VRDDETVDDHDAEDRRGPGRDVPQGACARRPVKEHPVTVAGEEHGHDPGSTVDDGGERAGEHLVEEGVEVGPFRACPVGETAQPLPRGTGSHAPAPGIPPAGALAGGHHARRGCRVAQQGVADPRRARHQGTAAVRAGALEVLSTPRAERALERAHDGTDLTRRQVDVAALAPGSHLEPTHCLILSRHPDRGTGAPSHQGKVAHAEIQ